MIDILKRNCPCCGEQAKTLFTINISTKTIEVCLSCMKELRDQLSAVIEKEERDRKMHINWEIEAGVLK